MFHRNLCVNPTRRGYPYNCSCSYYERKHVIMGCYTDWCNLLSEQQMNIDKCPIRIDK
jgi:hypothetical protein